MVPLAGMSERRSVVTGFQPSLSEWFQEIEHEDAEALQVEDVGKRDRLEVLRQVIGIEYDRVTAFPAVDFFACLHGMKAGNPPKLHAKEGVGAVQVFIAEHANDLCALRLVPHDPKLPKLRTRGRNLNDSLAWLEEQRRILAGGEPASGWDPNGYNVEFVEHSDTAQWSTIFVVREDGIFGTIVDGLHFQLTQGNTDEGNVSRAFLRTPDGTWQWSERDEEAEVHMKEILEAIRVMDREVQARLKRELGSEFTPEGFLMGYLETLLWPTKLVFIDYNRKLHEIIEPPTGFVGAGEGDSVEMDTIVKGIPASSGEAEGAVRLVDEDHLGAVEFNTGDILVTDNTDVRFLPLMRIAGAIVTDRGGILSHAAITARELGVPCVVGCKDATRKLSDGQCVRVDATRGIIRASEREVRS